MTSVIAVLGAGSIGQAIVRRVAAGKQVLLAHAGRYELVLESAHQFVQFVQQLWETMQAMPEYRDQTTFNLGSAAHSLH